MSRTNPGQPTNDGAPASKRPGTSFPGRFAIMPGLSSAWSHCWLTHNYRVIPGLAMRCEAEHCDGKGTHSPKELLRHRMGAPAFRGGRLFPSHGLALLAMARRA